jgi:hypothetical protein
MGFTGNRQHAQSISYAIDFMRNRHEVTTVMHKLAPSLAVLGLLGTFHAAAAQAPTKARATTDEPAISSHADFAGSAAAGIAPLSSAAAFADQSAALPNDGARAGFGADALAPQTSSRLEERDQDDTASGVRPAESTPLEPSSADAKARAFSFVVDRSSPVSAAQGQPPGSHAADAKSAIYPAASSGAKPKTK